jgi:signal transduction histidine kinase
MLCLYSNACKFTPTNGKLVITTKLVCTNPMAGYTHHSYNHSRQHSQHRRGSDAPSRQLSTHGRDRDEKVPHSPHPSHPPSSAVDEKCEHPLSAKSLNQHNLHHSCSAAIDTIVVRIEITDTGFGIRQKDLVKGKLFCERSLINMLSIFRANY